MTCVLEPDAEGPSIEYRTLIGGICVLCGHNSFKPCVCSVKDTPADQPCPNHKLTSGDVPQLSKEAKDRIYSNIMKHIRD